MKKILLVNYLLIKNKIQIQCSTYYFSRYAIDEIFNKSYSDKKMKQAILITTHKDIKQLKNII